MPTLLDAPLTLEQMADATVSMMALAADARETMPVESAGLLRTAARGLEMVQRSLLQEALELELAPAICSSFCARWIVEEKGECSHLKRSAHSVRLHGMQGVSGSNPLGSI